MENFDELTKEQLVEKVDRLEKEKTKLEGDLYWANLKAQKCDTMERVLNALGVIFEFYRNGQK